MNERSIEKIFTKQCKLSLVNEIQLHDYFQIFKNNVPKLNGKYAELEKSYRDLETGANTVIMQYDSQKECFFLKKSQTGFLTLWAEKLVHTLFLDIISKLGIKLYEPFSTYENQRLLFMNIEGKVFFIYENGIEELNNGLFKLLNGEVHIKPKQPANGTTYYYKVKNLSTGKTEIKSSAFVDTNDLMNYNNNNCFLTAELCDKFSKIE